MMTMQIPPAVLTITDAAYLFGQTQPQVSDGQGSAWGGQATPVLILD